MVGRAEDGDRPCLGAIEPVLRAWSMGCRDSDIGDRPASAGVIPFGRLSFLLHPCLRLNPPTALTEEGSQRAQLEVP
jgi:hypothetical protein